MVVGAHFLILNLMHMKKLLLALQKFFSVEEGYSILPGNF